MTNLSERWTKYMERGAGSMTDLVIIMQGIFTALEQESEETQLRVLANATKYAEEQK